MLKAPFFLTAKRVFKYSALKIATLLISVAIGLFLTIMVANLGGNIDKIYKGMIQDNIRGMLMGGWLKEKPLDEKEKIIEQTTWEMEEEWGLHEPFLLRTARWFAHGIVLELGESRYSYGGYDQDLVKNLILESLPYTLLLAGSANLFVFFISILFSLSLIKRFGSWLDKLSMAFMPLSAVPSWIYGLILILIFAGGLKLLPYPREVNIFQAENWLSYVPYFIPFMILPFAAIFLSQFFSSVFSWRSYLLTNIDEDYVDLAKAKGLPSYQVNRTYILRPALPYLLTSITLAIITLWQSVIALEVLFYWRGIGSLFIQGARRFDTQLVVGVVIVFAYLLAITIFILEITYALVDPRVKIGDSPQMVNAVKSKRKSKRFSGRWKKQAENLDSIPISQTYPGIPSVNWRDALKSWWVSFRFALVNLRGFIGELIRQPTAVIGLVIILILLIVSVYTVIALPYSETVSLWRREDNAFFQNPRMVPPQWINLFRIIDLPQTIHLSSMDQPEFKETDTNSEDTRKIEITFPFNYQYKEFPQDLVVILQPEYAAKLPLVNLTWVRPDGEEFNLGNLSVSGDKNTYYLSQDERIKRKIGEKPFEEGLFSVGPSGEAVIQPGQYKLLVTAFVFEPEADVDAEMILYGQVAGAAGTDHQRRDLSIALLWGLPVALAFGILGAILASLISLLIAVSSTWFGGWFDSVVQRITEVNMILPAIPIAIMVFIMYSKSIWAILGVLVLLSIFGSTVKILRAAILQIKDSAYIEAARAYGAGSWRIIFFYLIPHILPVVIPQMVILVPYFVFYEATLAFLGLSDPSLPTWGKVIYDAMTVGIYQQKYYWFLEPIALLLVTGTAFTMLGYALERILNPRLRAQ